MAKVRLKTSGSSFRDPSGYILRDDSQNIYRVISTFGKQNFDFVEKSGLYAALIDNGHLLPYENLDKSSFENLPDNAAYLLSHPLLPFTSYPYEWTFEQLRDAALLHLDLHLRALDHNVTMSDATAYNIQFIGHKPVFIDHLSFIPYHEGMLWKAQQQFTEQFLTPLLLWSKTGIAPNDWYKGTLKGITPSDLHKAMPWHKRLSFKYFNYIFLPSFFERKQIEDHKNAAPIENKLPKTGLVFILKQLRSWIANLKAPHEATVWGDYTQNRSYDDKELQGKITYITEKVGLKKPDMLWDIGCNSGEFSMLSLHAGAKHVVGLELDHGALATAYAHSKEKQAAFLPLYTNLSNPSGNIGWAQAERFGINQRANADFLLSLAVIHHIVIGNNVPLAEAIRYLLSLAPEGIIEWVPKTDRQIQRMLLNREDIFHDYDEDRFTQYLSELADITDTRQITTEGRKLFLYQRK